MEGEWVECKGAEPVEGNGCQDATIELANANGQVALMLCRIG